MATIKMPTGQMTRDQKLEKFRLLFESLDPEDQKNMGVGAQFHKVLAGTGKKAGEGDGGGGDTKTPGGKAKMKPDEKAVEDRWQQEKIDEGVKREGKRRLLGG